MDRRKKVFRASASCKKVQSIFPNQAKPTANLSQTEKLSTTFRCVFCNSKASVSVLIDEKNLIGNLRCDCGVTFQPASSMGSCKFLIRW
ncbi:hypothetical protein K470DRAFT_256799 [Piedraia hortae CBS 480.64]|uniref:Transcription elongation factor 1 homolog n=1 Tax=Piedraia hortae CBS 480.64 TaxID=1314780 RepID=A0A6A7C2D3_9PEZI|nr:hypothetical protein K470DRAFT_256799 [Piedraia hortae CBS 480.64]